MPIRVVCDSCQCAFKVADAAAGRRGKCPKCSAVLTIPDPAKVPAPPDPEIGLVPLADAENDSPYELAGQARQPVVGRAGMASLGLAGKGGEAPLLLTDADAVTTATHTPAEILAAFDEYIAPVKPTPLYRFWIVVVAGVMLLLPLIYVGLIFLVGWAVVYHATTNTGILQNVGGGRRQGQGAAFAYFAPILAGGFLIVFMIKPLFARSGKSTKTRSLDPSKEPLLFAFVDGVCSTVGARTPKRIDVDCQVNASAGFEGGPFSFLNRNLVLTIGLPLVSGLDMRQFAGVLAHEFGHFSQGAGMRLSTMIRYINFWFARVVYERDAWDEHLAAWSRGGDIRIMVFVWMFRGVVWLSRRVLWVLMMIGHVVSGFLLRQMEFDADRYEARMVGGETFESTARRLQVLNVAMHGAHVDLGETWREGRLADNFPRLVTANVAQIPPEALEKIDENVTAGTTGWFDTHPTDKDRIFRAHDEDTDGVFTLDGPATDVFRDFDSLCRAATFEYYEALFGKHVVDRDALRPVSEVVQTQTVAMAGSKALDRFSQGVFNAFRPFLLPEAVPRPPEDLKAAKQNLASARERMKTTLDAYDTALKRSHELRTEGIKVAAAIALLKAEYKPKPAVFGIQKAKLESAQEAREAIATELEELDDTLSVRESATIRRIHAALSLLETEAMAEVVPDGLAWREECQVLYPVARHIGRNVLPVLEETMQAQHALLMVLSVWQEDQENAKIHNAVRRAATILADKLTELSTKLGNTVAYPFDHAGGIVSLAQYALPRVPRADDVGELLDAAGESVDKILPLHFRVVGRLALATEEVEKILGMPPLPEKPKDEAEEAE